MNETTKRFPRTLQQAFGPHTSTSLCNGNCQQGRFCDCLPAVDSDEPPRGRLTATEAIALALVYTVSVAAMVAVGLHLWARLA